MLHAVPSPPASSPRLEKVAPLVEKVESKPDVAPAEPKPEEKAAPAPRPAATGRPKRELPPYLRVVK
jgi:hypothetical protein